MTVKLKSRNEIAEILNDEGVFPPSKYKAEVIKVTSKVTRISSKWTPNIVERY